MQRGGYNGTHLDARHHLVARQHRADFPHAVLEPHVPMVRRVVIGAAQVGEAYAVVHVAFFQEIDLHLANRALAVVQQVNLLHAVERPKFTVQRRHSYPRMVLRCPCELRMAAKPEGNNR